MGFSYLRFLAAITASCLIGISFEVQAQTDASEAAETGLAEITVTAQRREENQERVPVTVTALTADMLAAKSIQTESDLQAAVPGLTVQSFPLNNVLAFSIRGQTLDGLTASSPAVLPYINEAQINALSPSTFYDLSSVQVLKGPQGTLFGRNSTGGAMLYTTTAPGNEFGGYIVGGFGNYSEQHVKAAVDLPIVRDTVLLRIAGEEYGRDGYINNLFNHTHLGEDAHKSGRATLLLRPVEGLENSTVFQFARTGGNEATGAGYSAYPCGAPHGSASCVFGPTLDNIYGPGSWARYLAAHPGVPAAGLYQFVTSIQPRLGAYNVYQDDNNSDYGEDWFVINRTSYALAEKITLKNIFSADHSVSRLAGDLDGTPYGLEHVANGPLFSGRNNKLKDISDDLQIQGTGLLADTLDFVAGVYHSSQASELSNFNRYFDLAPVRLPFTSAPSYENDNRQIAGYVQATYHLRALLEGLSLTGGYRYTHEDLSSLQLIGSKLFGAPKEYQRYSKPSWEGGLQEQVTRSWMLYAVTRGSFRSGGFNASANATLALASQGGNVFTPETTKDVEIGSKFQGDLLNFPTRLNIALFRQWVSDIQRVVYLQTPGSVGAFTANVPSARVQGVEADGEIEPAKWLDVGAQLAFYDASFTKTPLELLGQPFTFGPFPATPRWSGSFYAQVGLPVPAAWGRVSVRGDVYAQSIQYFSSTNNTLPGTDLPGYHLLNFKAMWQNIGRTPLSLSGYVRNALNTTYYVGGIPFGNIFSVNSADPGVPRTYGMELEYKF